MPEPRKGDFVGIDPVAFKAMNADLASVKALIDAKLPKLRAAFTQAELSTGRIERLAAVSRWIESEMPSLRRRQLLAEQLKKEALQFGRTGAMVHSDWTGSFVSTEAAVARAKELAAQYKDGELPAEAWDEIVRNQHDPDFAEAFVKAIGPDAARMLAASSGNPKAWDGGKDKNAASHYSALASLFATASHRGVITDEWLDKFPGLVDLMRQGIWDNKLLIHVGQRALDSNQMDPGGNTRTADILAIVARSPIAANVLYTANFAKIQLMIRGEWPGWMATDSPALGDPLGTFVRSATVDARPIMAALGGVNDAELLTQQILLDVQKNPSRTPFAGVQDAYTAIVSTYFDDLYASVSGAVVPEYFEHPDVQPPGVNVPPKAWNAMVQQAMWNPDNAALLTVFFQAKTKERSDALDDRLAYDKNGAVQSPGSVSLSNWQNGQFRAWFTTQYAAVQILAAKEVADYNAKVEKRVGYIVDTASSAGFAAAGGPAGAAAAAGKTIQGFAKSAGIAAVKKEIASWFAHEVPKYQANLNWTYNTRAWQLKANSHLTDTKGRFPAVVDAEGRTWTGDTAYYEKRYGAKFTTGEIPPVVLASESMSPAALRAYAAWLEDPAVQAEVWPMAGPDMQGGPSGSSGG
ncbi:hypothetical protein OG474_08465 [Kribbella sp. NBC_01505]|uniref:hypothetical protein n=1 Tax=Kribbella sp. NBC_01505 TaxID=2903580 RepID=UPI00386B1302